MKIENGKERVILTEKEATLLCIARNIIADIYDQATNDDILEYANNIVDDLDNLLSTNEYDSFEVVQEKHNKNGNVTLVRIEF